MTRQLARNLYHLMRGAARRTSVERLKRTGHKTVSVLSFRDVQALIERAVENTLRRRGIRLDGPGVQEEVRHEFLALMQERDTLQRTVDQLMEERERLAANRDQLSVAIQAAEAEYLDAASSQPDELEAADLAELRARVEERLRELLAGHPAGEVLMGEQALSLVVQAIDEQREAALGRAQGEHETHLRDLRRRLDRLKAKLSETEEMLARARAQGGLEAIEGEHVDPGLSAGDPNYKKKKELLGEIFRLNVELRDMLKERTPAPSSPTP
jgi:hypothetical protein